jgi:hypothetical protein
VSGGRVNSSLVWACGTNEYGQLGLSYAQPGQKFVSPEALTAYDLAEQDQTNPASNPDNPKEKYPKIVDIYASERASVAVSKDVEIHAVYVWGMHPGLDTQKIVIPTSIKELERVTWLAEQLDDVGQLTVTDFQVLQVLTATNHHMLLCQFNTAANKGRPNVVFGWGDTQFGKMGIGNVAKYWQEQEKNQKKLEQEKKKDNDGGNESKGEDSSKALPLSHLKSLKQQRIKFLTSKTDHVIMINSDNEAFAWGNGESGKLGVGDGTGSGAGKSENAPKVIPLFHKAERQQLAMAKFKAKNEGAEENLEEKHEQETKSARKRGQKAAHEETEDLSGFSERLLRQKYSEKFNIYKASLKKVLRQTELMHAAIQKRCYDSQASVTSLTSRYRLHEEVLFKRLTLEALAKVEAQKKASQSEDDDEKPAYFSEVAAMDLPNSGSATCCFSTNALDWNTEIEVKSVGDLQSSKDADAQAKSEEAIQAIYNEEVDIKSKVSFENESLNQCELMATRLYMRPCSMFQAFDYHRVIIKELEDKMNDSKEIDKTKVHDMILRTVDVILKTKNMFVNLCFSVYDLVRDEDIRIYNVFLKKMLEEVTKNKDRLTLMNENSLEWAVFRQYFLEGKQRRQLADIMAQVLASLGEWAGEDPAELLYSYSKSKKKAAVLDGLTKIRTKAQKFFDELLKKPTFENVMRIVKVPFTILHNAFVKNKVKSEEFLGRMMIRVLVDVMLTDQTYQFNLKKQDLIRKSGGFGQEAASKASASDADKGGPVRFLEILRSNKPQDKMLVDQYVARGASSLGASETLVILKIKDMVTERLKTDLSDLMFYAISKYKVPDVIMREEPALSNVHQQEMEAKMKKIYDFIVISQEEAIKARGSGTDKSKMDLLTDMFRMSAYFPRRIIHIPRNSMYYLSTKTFNPHNDTLRMRKEIGFPSYFTDEEMQSDFKRVNLRVDPSRCDFQYRRLIVDKPCDQCGLMHPKDSAQSGGKAVDASGLSKLEVHKFTDLECDLMLECLDEDVFFNKIRELSSESCWNSIFTELVDWREKRIETYSQMDGHYHYEVLTYAFKKLRKISKGSKIKFGEEYSHSFILDTTLIEPAYVVENLKERFSLIQERSAQQRMAKECLQRICYDLMSSVKSSEAMTKTMIDMFQNITAGVVQENKLKFVGLDSNEIDQKIKQQMSRLMLHLPQVSIFRERGKVLRLTYADLVSQGILYRVKPLRKFLPFVCFCCFQMWSCCRCMDTESNELVSFLSNASFIFLSSANPDIVNLKLAYAANSENFVILRSISVSLTMLSDALGCVCHKIMYDPVGDDVPLTKPITFQFSKSRLFRLLTKLPRNISDDGATDPPFTDVI